MPAYTFPTRIKLSVLLSTAVLSTTLLAACNDSEKVDHTHQEVAVIASKPAPFNGAFFSMLGYYIESNSHGQQLVSYIQDFEFEWGFEVTARIEVVTLAEPLEDGPLREYRLLEVVDRTEDEIGTLYEYDYAPAGFEIDEENEGYYLFFGQTFRCADNIDCEQLVRLSSDNVSFQLQFEYLGQSDERPTAVMLNYWN